MNPLSDPLFIYADLEARFERAESYRRHVPIGRPRRRWRRARTDAS